PRSVVPRPHRDPYPVLRGRQPCRMVRRQLPGLRKGQDAPARPGLDHPASREVQEADAVSGSIMSYSGLAELLYRFIAHDKWEPQHLAGSVKEFEDRIRLQKVPSDLRRIG